MTNKPTVMHTLLQSDKSPLSITEKIGDETHSIHTLNNKPSNRLHNLIQADYAFLPLDQPRYGRLYLCIERQEQCH